MPPETLEFSRRAVLSEWMDETRSYSELSACLRDLVKVNRLLRAYWPTLRWLEQVARTHDGPLHIVDVGCGAGDMLRRIDSWSREKGIAVSLTGIDANPMAVQTARDWTAGESCIEWIACQAADYCPTEPIDLVISSLVTHHLSDAEIVNFLEWMERNARLGWFINDLNRGRGSYYGFKLLASAMRWHPFVRHDGPVSIRRSFTPADWSRYISEAGLEAGGVHIFKVWPGRLCVSRVK
ncbi:MAG TPA: methyltransferase domain-containing protein [Terracidiphilus sp.]|nr:methyltransferase domain-containing protein [Terracidiphilus sp.]